MTPRVFNVYKPKGMGSFDVVRHFKRNLPPGFGKIGHFGTLDPFAEGVLLIGISGAQRLNNLVHDSLPKTYTAVGVFGKKTETGDLTVDPIEVLEYKKVQDVLSQFNKHSLEEIFSKSFLGDYLQSPPMYSAVKHEGVPLHRLARKGIKVEKPKKRRFIYDLEILDINDLEITFKVTVSSGTYIRTLFEDMATEIGLIGTLKDLRRDSIGHLSFNDSQNKSLWPLKDESYDIESNSYSVDQVLKYKKYFIKCENERSKYKNGQPISLNEGQRDFQGGEKVWVFGSEVLGLGEFRGNKIFSSINFPQTD